MDLAESICETHINDTEINSRIIANIGTEQPVTNLYYPILGQYRLVAIMSY